MVSYHQPEDLERLKTANPIGEVLRVLGIPFANHRFRCPNRNNHKHGDRTPSVTVWPERGSFKCWVCPDFKGDVIDLVKMVRNCSFGEALQFLESRSRGRISTPAGPAETFAKHGAQANARHGEAPSRPRMAAAQTGLFGEHSWGAGGTPAAADAGVAAATDAGGASPVADAERGEARRREILAAFLDLLAPVWGRAGQYLRKRRIFKRTWDAQRLRMIADYGEADRRLSAAFPRADLEAAGFVSQHGHLRFYRHRLIFPYFDREGRPVYLQARAIEDAMPKELSLKGPVPLPYNVALLDGSPGHLYLCEGVIDALTLIEQGFKAVAVPGALNFKPAWAPLFRGKVVHVAFDSDEAGETGAKRVMVTLREAGVDARRLPPPPGMDINEWFQRGAPPR